MDREKVLLFGLIFAVLVFGSLIYINTFDNTLSFNKLDKTYYISEDNMNTMNSLFSYIGKEQAFCMYSTNTDKIYIKDPISINNTFFSVKYRCSKYEGNYIGSIHTHPGWILGNDLSHVDAFDWAITETKLLGVMYAYDKITLFERVDNKIYLVNLEVLI